MYPGKTPQQATAACIAQQGQGMHGSYDVERDKQHCKEVRKAYGPYKRKLLAPNWKHDEYDDSEVYRFWDSRGYFIDEDGDAPCFPAGTLIMTPDGVRPIESLAPGDLVQSFSIEEEKMLTGRVTRVKQRKTPASKVLELQLSDGTMLRLTMNHPLRSLSRAAWIPAGELRVGETLAGAAGKKLKALTIISISQMSETAPDSELPVYELTVEPTHSYFANGVVAHNY
jgi:hypothetical protein